MVINNNGNWVDSPIHKAFGLTYASFLVIPRLLMENMPWEWQVDMVDLMEEFVKKFEWEKDNETINIFTRGENGKLMSIDKNLCNYRRGDTSRYEKDSGEAV